MIKGREEMEEGETVGGEVRLKGERRRNGEKVKAGQENKVEQGLRRKGAQQMEKVLGGWEKGMSK